MTFSEFVSKHNITINNTWADSNPNMQDSAHMNHFKTSLKMRGRQMTLYFSQGYGISGEPQSDDVLSCLVSDAWGFEDARDFEDWASGYGYDTDSRKAERTYKAIEREVEKLKKFAGDLYDELLSCEE